MSEQRPINAREFRRAVEELQHQLEGYKDIAKAMDDYVARLAEVRRKIPGAVDDEDVAKLALETRIVNDQIALVDKALEPMDVVLDYLDPDGAR